MLSGQPLLFFFSPKKWGDARIELATSCTRSKNHTTRPITLEQLVKVFDDPLLPRKLGRVVKALALGANLVRGTGSNPVACNFCCVLFFIYYCYYYFIIFASIIIIFLVFLNFFILFFFFFNFIYFIYLFFKIFLLILIIIIIFLLLF